MPWFRTKKQIEFAAAHEGRGGHVSVQVDGTETLLPIEMAHGGIFIVSFTRLSREEIDAIEPFLLTWLQETGRSAWVLERPHAGT